MEVVDEDAPAGEAPGAVDPAVVVEVAAPVVEPDAGEDEEVAPTGGVVVADQVDLVRRGAVTQVCRRSGSALGRSLRDAREHGPDLVGPGVGARLELEGRI